MARQQRPDAPWAANRQPNRTHRARPQARGATGLRRVGWTGLRRAGDRTARGGVIALIYLYQGVASVFPKACRFEPSCSNYGLEAVRVHGALTGGWLTLKRILRCRPGGGFGIDPVPPRGCAHADTGHDHTAGPDQRPPERCPPERRAAG